MEVRNINEGKLHAEELRTQWATWIGKGLRYVHTGYGLVVFTALFLLFLPWLCIPMIFPRAHALIGILNRWWARALFALVGIPWKIEYRFTPERGKQYVFCPNHFSYLDVPTVGLNTCNTIFVGKSEMRRVPLFGWMYSRLHITVNRARLKSRYESLIRAAKAIDEGKSLTIFPEGGIVSNDPPRLARFKDGAFRLAIEKQIPVVPVTIPFNWIILPDDTFLLTWGRVVAIFHEPIHTEGLRLEHVDELKARVHEIIRNELNRWNYGNRPPVTG
ncbi:MAG TPA: lysophospholipid acyltransferase family protein [Cyclobacteriaceae bacterium]